MIVRCKLFTGPTLSDQYSEAIRKAGYFVVGGTENVYWDVEVSGQSRSGSATWNTAADMLRVGAPETIANVVRMYAREEMANNSLQELMEGIEK